MALCAPTTEEAWANARESFEWYPKAGARLIAHDGRLDGRPRPGPRQLRATRPTCKAVADDGSSTC